MDLYQNGTYQIFKNKSKFYELFTSFLRAFYELFTSFLFYEQITSFCKTLINSDLPFYK